MSLPPDQDPTRPVGASAVGEGTNPKRRRWLLPLLLALALIILASLLLSQCGDDDDEVTGAPASATPTAETATEEASDTMASETTGSSATATSSSSAPSASATGSASAPNAAPPAAGAAGQIVTTDGGAVVLPLVAGDPTGGLGQYMNQAVTATGVQVESVPADEGFWVGSSATDRVFLQLDTSSESPFQVQVGQRVSFTGVVQPAPAGYAETVGVDQAEGADQLTAQGHHILINTASLTLAE